MATPEVNPMAPTTEPVAVPSTAVSVPIAVEQTKVKLYWLEKSRSQRILWLLEELKVPYELEIFRRDPKTHFAGPDLKKIHALGKSPVISVTVPGSDKPVIIAESGFIVEYLLDHFGNGSTLLPKRYKEGQEGKIAGETEEWLRFRYYLHYAEGSIMPFMIIALVAINIRQTKVPFFIKPITNTVASQIGKIFLEPNFKTHFEFLESQLDSSPENGQYLCGPRLTGADILVSYPLIAGGDRAGLTKEKYPKLKAYVDRLLDEPGYKKAVQKIIEIDGKFEATI